MRIVRGQSYRYLVINRAAYPYTDVPSFMFWPIPSPGQDMWDWQRLWCAMCDGRGNLVLDHDHLTGRKRGYLCRSCNSLEGSGRDTRGWPAWRAGLNPARLLGEDDIYISPRTGQPVIRAEREVDERGVLVSSVRAAEILQQIFEQRASA